MKPPLPRRIRPVTSSCVDVDHVFCRPRLISDDQSLWTMCFAAASDDRGRGCGRVVRHTHPGYGGFGRDIGYDDMFACFRVEIPTRLASPPSLIVFTNSHH
jgi:hypothetical protein